MPEDKSNEDEYLTPNEDEDEYLTPNYDPDSDNWTWADWEKEQAELYEGAWELQQQMDREALRARMLGQTPDHEA